MPANGFPFAIRVGGDINAIGLLDSLPQFRKDFLGAGIAGKENFDDRSMLTAAGLWNFYLMAA